MPVCVRSPLAAAAKPAHSSSAGLLSNTHPLHQSLNSGKALKNSEEARPAADFSVRFSLPRDATGRRINLRLERESLSKSPASRSSCGDEKISVRSQESVDEPLTSPIASSKGRDEEENNRKSPAEAPWKALHQHLSKLLYSASLCDMLEEGEGQSEAILEAEKTCQDHCSVPHGDTSSLNDGTWKFAMNEKIKEESMKPFWNTSTQWTSEESPAQAFVGFPSMESATHSPSTVSPTMAVWTEYMNYCAWYYLWRQEHPQSSSPWTEAAPRCSTQKGERPGEEQLAPEIHRTPRYVDRGVSPLASTMNQNQSLTDSVCRGSAAQTLCPSSNPRKVHYYSQKAPYTHGKRFVPLHFEDAKKARVSPSRFTVAKYFPSSEFETVQETGPSADTAREAVAKLQQDNYQPYRLSSRADMSLSQPPREIKTAGREKGGSALASPRLLRRDGINVARSIRGRTSREPGLSVYERKTNELRSLPPSWRNRNCYQMTSVAWADHDVVNQEEVDFSRDDASSNSYSDNDMWDSIKPNVIFDVDEHGNRLEVIKKVRQYVVERPARASDLRRKVAAFGKAKGQEKSDTIVSKEPQLALELGSADIFERESRAEIKRLIGENIADTSAKGAAKEENDADGEPGAATWGTNRATTSTFKTASAADVRRRIRVCNVSDDITEENLHNIFSANGAEVERVFLATDKETGNNKGYAFITFRDEKWVLAAVQQRRFNFKNVVLAVSHAMDKKI